MTSARALRRCKPRARSLELDVLLEALSQSFLRAQARLEVRQRESIDSLAGLALRVELDGRIELVPMSDLVPARQHRIHELKIEFECTSAYVRVGAARRLGLRLGPRSGRPRHRACLILSDGSPARAELRIDGEHVRCVSLAGDAHEREGPLRAATARTRPDVLLVAPRDAARVAAIVSPSRSSNPSRRRSRSAAASPHRARR